MISSGSDEIIFMTLIFKSAAARKNDIFLSFRWWLVLQRKVG